MRSRHNVSLTFSQVWVVVGFDIRSRSVRSNRQILGRLDSEASKAIFWQSSCTAVRVLEQSLVHCTNKDNLLQEGYWWCTIDRCFVNCTVRNGAGSTSELVPELSLIPPASLHFQSRSFRLLAATSKYILLTPMSSPAITSLKLPTHSSPRKAQIQFDSPHLLTQINTHPTSTYIMPS